MPHLGSASEYQALAEQAGFELLKFDDVTRNVERTWPAIVRRLAAKLATNPRYPAIPLQPTRTEPCFYPDDSSNLDRVPCKRDALRHLHLREALECNCRAGAPPADPRTPPA
jgi:hypothetical protein